MSVFRIIGVGPGDPELMTLKAARLIAAAPVVACFAKAGRAGRAHRIAAGVIPPSSEVLRFDYPFTTEIHFDNDAYTDGMCGFYDACAARIAKRLDDGADVALLCEGDPFFYGSAMYLHDRLAARYASEIVPGVTGMSACWSRAGVPMAHGDDTLTVLPGTLDEETLALRLAGDDAAVVMKIGRHMPKIRAALARAGRDARAVCVIGGSTPEERIIPLAGMNGQEVPYFAVVLVPGREARR